MAIQSSEEKQKSLSGDKLLRFFGDSRNFQERLNLRGSSLAILFLSPLARLLKKLLVPRFSRFLPLRFLGGHFCLQVLKVGRHQLKSFFCVSLCFRFNSEGLEFNPGLVCFLSSHLG